MKTCTSATGLYWEKAAYEEAEHAAKFAELLGEELEPNMKASTKANLAWRVDCEFGATQGKVDLASCAKKNNLDAIHDTVHEMARDMLHNRERDQAAAAAGNTDQELPKPKDKNTREVEAESVSYMRWPCWKWKKTSRGALPCLVTLASWPWRKELRQS